MQKQLISSIVLVGVLGSSGCATIIHGSHDQVKIHSNEPGSTIYVNDKEIGADLVDVPLKRGKISALRASKAGCEDARIDSQLDFDYLTLLGIFIDLGIFTVTTDVLTGNAYRLAPRDYELTPACGK